MSSNKHYSPYCDDEPIGTINSHMNDYFTLPAGSTLLVHVYDHENGDILDRIKKYTVLEDICVETKSQPFKASFLGSIPNPNKKKQELEFQIESLERTLKELKNKLVPLVS